MPLVQIFLLEGKSQQYIQAIADGTHAALCKTWAIPTNDRFQIIHELKKQHFIIDKTMWVKRSDDAVVIYITSIARRTEQKLSFYREVADLLQKNPGIRQEDIFISLINNETDNWSFGKGIAQLRV